MCQKVCVRAYAFIVPQLFFFANEKNVSILLTHVFTVIKHVLTFLQRYIIIIHN